MVLFWNGLIDISAAASLSSLLVILLSKCVVAWCCSVDKVGKGYGGTTSVVTGVDCRLALTPASGWLYRVEEA